jgi:protein-disulfide isomerase
MLAASLFAQPTGSVSSPLTLDKGAFETYVRHLFLWGPQVKVVLSEPNPSELPGFFDLQVTASAGSATQQETFLVSADGKKVVRGTIYDLAKNPFDEDLARLHTENAPKFGSDSAPLKLVIFSDLQCGYCRKNTKTMREQVLPAFGPQLQIAYKDYPLDPIHPWARTAAVAGRCIYKQKANLFWDFEEWIFGRQEQLTAANFRGQIADFAKSHQLDPAALTSCLDSKSAAAEVEQSMSEARALGVNSTPTMFLNGRRLVGALPWEEIKEILTQELAYARKPGAGKNQ